MQSYGNITSFPGCRDHSFLCVPHEEADDIMIEIKLVQDASLEQWLEQLCATYGSEDKV